MSRLLLTTVLWHLALSFSAAQSARIFNQVVASTGKEAVQQGLMYSYTVGEVVISTVSSDERSLTQGFHQPEQTQLVSVSDPALADWNIEVFPNPVSDWLTVRFSLEKGDRLSVNVFDVAGKAILLNQILSEPDGSQIDCSRWQPGVYFLQVFDPVSRANATLRLVRL